MHRTSATRREASNQSDATPAKVLAMRQRTPGSGRRSKGSRHIFTTRIPTPLASQLRADAERLELSYSDFIANVVAEKYGLPPVAEPKGKDQMKLTA